MKKSEKRTCPICKTKFTPSRRNQIYDKPSCGTVAANRRRRGADDPEAVGSQPMTEDERADRLLERKVREAQARSQTSAREAAAAKREIEVLGRELADAQAALDLYIRPLEDMPEWTRAEPQSRVHRGTVLAFLSDVHTGETVRAEEMNEYNAYNEEITDARLRRFFERTIVVSRNYLAGVEYDGVVLALGGDMVSGDIHDELEQTNWCSTYDACRWLAPRLQAGIEMLAEEFGKVLVVSAPGNHGRDSKKPRHKGRSAHNADTHAAHLVADRLEGEVDISFLVPESFDVDFELYGYRFSMEHGDNMRFSGVSEIGAIGPVKRGTLRKSRQAQTEGRPFVTNLVGHFHQYIPAYTQGFIMNGSLKGYDEYARSWHFTPEPAQQALAVVTPEHGITVNAPVIVTKRSEEGW